MIRLPALTVLVRRPVASCRPRLGYCVGPNETRSNGWEQKYHVTLAHLRSDEYESGNGEGKLKRRKSGHDQVREVASKYVAGLWANCLTLEAFLAPRIFDVRQLTEWPAKLCLLSV